MEITGKNNIYEVKWMQSGGSYAVPTVFKKNTFFFGMNKIKRVWEGDSVELLTVEKMLPEQTEILFKESVKQYEEYQLASE